MDALFHAAPYIGYVYPNETVVPWGILIVVYPYLTGLVAGAFVVSAFYHVFGLEQFRPVARFALLTALALMIFVPLPLLLHLGHPERAFNAMITPHWTSAFAAFSYAASFYVFVLMLEIWFAFRADVVRYAQGALGPRRAFYYALALGSLDVSENALRHDRAWAHGLAIVGVAAAMLLHGYVGFVFGSLKSREWWGSDLMPVIFLLSAAVSGIALLIVLYVIACGVRRETPDDGAMQGLARALWGFLIAVVVMEVLEFVTLLYKSREGIETVMELLAGPIRTTLLLQAIGSAIPLVVLTALVASGTRGRRLVLWLSACSVLIVLAVFAMRWNVVIGGQELSKTMKGLVTYQLPFWGREGLLAVSLILAAPMVLLAVLVRLFPPWETRAGSGRAAGG